jgi:hypothetical protein
MRCLKLLDEGIMARHFNGQGAELQIRVALFLMYAANPIQRKNARLGEEQGCCLNSHIFKI